ncbi:MAG: AlgP family protein, partial [Planctomycetia bacterium]
PTAKPAAPFGSEGGGDLHSTEMLAIKDLSKPTGKPVAGKPAADKPAANKPAADKPDPDTDPEIDLDADEPGKA